MDLITSLLNLLLHIDKTMLQFIENYGVWIYVLLVVIIFSETGLVFMPFLPGDSLLFVAGAICAMGKMDIYLLIALLTTAAIVGDAVNYAVGRWFGAALIERTTLVNPKHLAYTQGFYDRYGGQTVIIARFIPFARTLAPFVAGFALYDPKKFVFFNVTGAIIWVVSLTVAGYWFGNLPFVRDNLTLVILFIIFLSILPGIIAFLRAKFAQPAK
jgi:membrane-associated protein